MKKLKFNDQICLKFPVLFKFGCLKCVINIKKSQQKTAIKSKRNLLNLPPSKKKRAGQRAGQQTRRKEPSSMKIEAGQLGGEASSGTSKQARAKREATKPAGHASG